MWRIMWGPGNIHNEAPWLNVRRCVYMYVFNLTFLPSDVADAVDPFSGMDYNLLHTVSKQFN